MTMTITDNTKKTKRSVDQLTYLKYGVCHTGERTIAAQLANFEYLNAPRIKFTEQSAQLVLSGRLHAERGQALPGETVRVRQGPFHAADL